MKKEKSIEFNVVNDYSGYHCPILSFPKSVLQSPIFDRTMKLEKGETFVGHGSFKNTLGTQSELRSSFQWFEIFLWVFNGFKVEGYSVATK